MAEGTFAPMRQAGANRRNMLDFQGNQLNLLMSLLQPGAFNSGGAGANFFYGGRNPLDALLATPSPEMRTFDTVRPILEGMLTGTGPQFEQDIARANSTGGRFSSGNAIMRGEALRNLFNQRNQTAQTLGMLGGQAGSAQWDRQFNAQNQMLQLLAGLLGMGSQVAFQQPVQQRGASGFGDFLKILAPILMSGFNPAAGAATAAGNFVLPGAPNA